MSPMILHDKSMDNLVLFVMESGYEANADNFSNTWK